MPTALVLGVTLLAASFRPHFAGGEDELATAIIGNEWIDRVDGSAGGFTPIGDCRTCHVMTEKTGHPVGMQPRGDLPDSLPLDAGRLSCTTCHESSAAAHNRAKRNHDRMLRPLLATGNSCTPCHEPADQSTPMGHAMAIGRAHSQVDRQRFSASAMSVGGLDSESRTCMGCHDGSRGTGLGVSHPVGVPYDDMKWATTGSRHRLTDRQQLDARVRLFDGNVGCGSCHNTYSQTAKMLSVPNTQGQLCISCHHSEGR